MRSSGIKRGLAVSAIAALAATGVPAAAMANTVSQQVGEGVSLFSQFSGIASTKPDGQNSTVRLEAGAEPGITALTFQYRLSEGEDWQDIATVGRNDDGAFSHEWNAAALNGSEGVEVRAIADTSDEDSAQDSRFVNVTGNADAVNLNTDSQQGVFQAPYAERNGQYFIYRGTTSSTDTDEDVTAGWFRGEGEPVFNTTNIEADDDDETGTFDGVLDITGYDYSGDPDQLVVGAVSLVADDDGQPADTDPDMAGDQVEFESSDDVEAYTLYIQTIGTVTAVADNTTVPEGTDTTITITVNDQSSAPIAGAEVRRGSDDALIGYTDENGQVDTDNTDSEVEGQNGGTTEYYYANATDSDPYEPELGDKRSGDVTIEQYDPAPSSLVADSDDGAAFDFDEYDAQDITVQVQDQEGANFPSTDEDTTADQVLTYRWEITPFDEEAEVSEEAEADRTAADLDGDGEYEIVFPEGEPSGTYELFASLGEDPGTGQGGLDEESVLIVKAGEAEIRFDEDSPEQALIGGSETVDGRLVLEDGTGLVGRLLDVNYAGDDAGITQSNGSTGANRQVTTGAGGAFSVTVEDADSEDPAEESGTVTVSTANNTADDEDEISTTDVSDLDGNAATEEITTVNFVVSETPGEIEVLCDEEAFATPGRPVDCELFVTDDQDTDPETPGDQGSPLPNAEVTLTIDRGFFTDGEPDPAPADGADAGEFHSLGQEITVQTDGDGEASFTVAIERDAGFDDDGLVTSTITATAGSVSDTDEVEWTSEFPLNGGAVDLVLSPAANQESSDPADLPNVQETDSVCFNVFTTDQFGNRVAVDEDEFEGELTVSDDSELTNVGEDRGISSNYALDCDFSVFASNADEVTVTVTWEARTTTYDGTDGAVDDEGSETLTDSFTVNFYETNYSASTFTLAPASGCRTVGSTVVVTYTALDQFGQPIEDLYMQFFRSGPDPQQNGEQVQASGFTGEDGQITYVFQGAVAGPAIITAVGRDEGTDQENQLGPVVPQAQRSTTYTFAATCDGGGGGGGGGGGAADIEADLSGKSKGVKDVIKVNAEDAAAGATVTLFKKVTQANGKVSYKKVALKSGTLNSAGNKKFKVRDKNGSASTKYIVKVSPTATSQGDKTRIRIR